MSSVRNTKSISFDFVLVLAFAGRKVLAIIIAFVCLHNKTGLAGPVIQSVDICDATLLHDSVSNHI